MYLYVSHPLQSKGRVAQSVWRLATSWTVQGSIPGGGEIFRTCPDRSWGPASLLYNGYRVFLGGKERLGRDADPSTSSSAVVKKGYTYTTPLLPLRAVQPVQSLSACRMVHFTTLYFSQTSVVVLRIKSFRVSWVLNVALQEAFDTCETDESAGH